MTTVGSGHLSYYQAPEQGFQGCLETTRADLGSGPPVCWVRQTGYVAAEPAPARRSSPRPRSEPASVRGAACVLRGADQRRGPGRGRIRCMEIRANTWCYGTRSPCCANACACENRDTIPYQYLSGHTVDRPRRRRPAPAQHDLPLWPSDSRT